jgi:FAD/FMN-containing dehydrogenase
VRMNLAGFLEEMAGAATVATDAASLRRGSRDFYWYSPALRRQLDSVLADAVVSAHAEADVVTTLAACFRNDVPLTARGAGSGNYGQAMPLRGGVVLDMTGLNEVLWVKNGACRVQAGCRLLELDEVLAKEGQELRLHPSTRSNATVGGFVAGGSGGVGSINWGMLRERGNILGGRLVTMEAEPRVLELRGDDIAKFNHSYGVTGVLTELELPLAPACDWVDAVVVFDDFMQAARFGQTFAEQPGILKKQCAVMAAPIVQDYLRPISGFVGAEEACVLVMVAEPSWEAFDDLVAEAGGRIAYRKTKAEVAQQRLAPIYELCWNHTTLWALKRDPSLTYLQTLFPAGANLELADRMRRHFGDETLMHLEFTRSGPVHTCSGLQIVRFTTEARLNEIMAFYEANGCRVFNPHVFTLEEGGMKQVNQTQLAFKRQADPKGLLNPGKMLGWEDNDWRPAPAADPV